MRTLEQIGFAVIYCPERLSPEGPTPRPVRHAAPGGVFSGESKMPKPLSIEVVRRAYELWQLAGESEGRDREFYLEAERQLTEAAEKDPPKDE
jgi:hypothetical protein